MIDLKLIEQLTNAWGVSGNENQVRQIIRKRIKKNVDDVRVDAMGNLIAFKRAKSSKLKALKVMIAGHMDEVGLMVTHIDKSGYLKFNKVGGIDDRVLLAKRALIGKDRVPGVIGVRPIHMLARKGEHKKVSSHEDLFIDIGAASLEEAQRWVSLGDYVMFDTSYEDWGGLIKGKAFDDRIGCYMMIELLKKRYSFDLYAAFTTQEEIGLRGGRVAAYRHLPDMAFILEGTPAGDFPQPKVKDVSRAPALGKGPVITIMDRSVFCDKGLIKLLTETAKANRIPVQIKRPGTGGTDAGRIHLTRTGVKTAVLAIPSRYIHSPVCLISKRDVASGLKLMEETFKKLK
ncbi:M42 family metallopeptidase [candidate division TA06 bacterium]|uniref:M42 family metallopeptidase n=1 Tax=candidate division TA06 bacterium TaxID=2250710 RepID=A0A933IG72_UNCT6|nr:M42 family metallopeptidase [candidate division TA06 bacterium]